MRLPPVDPGLLTRHNGDSRRFTPAAFRALAERRPDLVVKALRCGMLTHRDLRPQADRALPRDMRVIAHRAAAPVDAQVRAGAWATAFRWRMATKAQRDLRKLIARMGAFSVVPWAMMYLRKVRQHRALPPLADPRRTASV